MSRSIRRTIGHTIRLFVVGSAATVLFWGGILFAWSSILSIPSIDNFDTRRIAESTKIYDRTGNVLLYDVHGAVRRTAVPLEDISRHLRNATIAIEDTTFYSHYGFRPFSFFRAMAVNVLSGSYSQGGSTITQQVVKNTLLTQEKKLTRKLKEILLAIKLEHIYTKDQILSAYLNETPYGGTLYGVEEASQYFFGVSAKEATLAQAAYMPSLPQAPTRYSPYGTHRDELEKRKDLVLQRMFENGFIEQEEYDNAKKENIEFKSEATAGIRSPHFVFFVREYVEKKYGVEAVANGGLKIITTLDYDLQKKAEDVVLSYALSNEKNFNAENAGLLAIDPSTGQILTMVGSRGYFDTDIDGMVNVTVTPQQPGSAFKPFVYAAAFEKGYTPETIVFDVKTQFAADCKPDDMETHEDCYSPENYDGVFRGPITLRSALAQSINIPAVKVLYMTGVENALRYATSLGVTTLGNRDQYGLTLVLGGGEVYLLDMVSAYGVFANDGVKNTPVAILKVEDADGTVLEEYTQKSERVIPISIARTISDILSDDKARSPAFGEASSLYIPGSSVAAKTGTTNDYRDAWIIGYTKTISAGAWAGNNDNSAMEKRVAGFIVAPLWNEFMRYAVQKYPSERFAPPPPETQLDDLHPMLRGVWNASPSGEVHDLLYWVEKDNPRSGKPGSAGDPQLPLWEYSVQRWLQGTSSLPLLSAAPVTQGGSSLFIVQPKQGAVLQRGTPFAVIVDHKNPNNVTRIALYLNGQYVGSVGKQPYILSVTPTDVGSMTLRAVAESSSGAEETSVQFSVR